jgi:hypothetical protein
MAKIVHARKFQKDVQAAYESAGGRWASLSVHSHKCGAEAPPLDEIMGFRGVSCNGTVFSLVLTIGLLGRIVQIYWEAFGHGTLS